MSKETTAPRYFMHKYWGKKPASGISPLVDRYTKPGDTIKVGYSYEKCYLFDKNQNTIWGQEKR